MPIYEFVCEECGKEFEELIMGGRREVQCPACSSARCRKKMSAFAFKSGSNFVGTGKKASVGGCSGCSSSSCATCGG